MILHFIMQPQHAFLVKIVRPYRSMHKLFFIVEQKMQKYTTEYYDSDYLYRKGHK